MAAVDQLALAMSAYARGDHAGAAEPCREALRLDPARPDAWLLHGVLARQAGDLRTAVTAYREALRLKPDYAEAWVNLGNALGQAGRVDEAGDCLDRAVALRPDFAPAWTALGNLRLQANRALASVAAFQRAAELEPAQPDTWNNLGKACWSAGDVAGAVAGFRQALALGPDNVQAHHNLLTLLQYDARLDAAQLLQEHRAWDAVHAAGLTRRAPKRDPDPERRLRIGYVSWNFRRDAAGCFIASILDGHDHAGFEIVAYSDNPAGDAYTERFRARVDVWVDSHALSDVALCDRVEADAIDILVDLTGHTGRSRLGAFARRPAPVQVTWLGYEGSTGLTEMDWLIGDWHVTPVGAEAWCSEGLIRLPHDFQCFTPPADVAQVAPPPCLDRGHVTFGCFNKPAKLDAQVLALWSALLQRLPDARLLLKNPAFADPELCRSYLERFGQWGIAPERIEFRGASPYVAMMAEYADMDIALDPFPFSGGATTCDALWMGVPVVTLRGERFAANHTISHLSAAGFPQWVAASRDDYVAIAADLAADPDYLRDLRRRQRGLIAASPLCDARSYMAQVELALRRVWRRWCVNVAGRS